MAPGNFPVGNVGHFFKISSFFVNQFNRIFTTSKINAFMGIPPYTNPKARVYLVAVVHQRSLLNENQTTIYLKSGKPLSTQVHSRCLLKIVGWIKGTLYFSRQQLKRVTSVIVIEGTLCHWQENHQTRVSPSRTSNALTKR